MNKSKFSPLRLTLIAVFMAMTIALSSFSIPVPGGHLYMCDISICLAALLLNPFEAFLVGGVGSFLGDMIFYPAPMFVSLATHGIQSIVISLIARNTLKKHPQAASWLGTAVGAVIMVIGYTLGRAYVYSTPEYAIIKLPFEILQAVVGAVVGTLLCWQGGIRRIFMLYMREE